MRSILLRLLVGLVIVLGITSANSAAANIQIEPSPTKMIQNVPAIEVVDIRGRTVIENIASNRRSIGAVVEEINIRISNIAAICIVSAISNISDTSRIATIQPEIIDANIRRIDVDLSAQRTM